MSALSKLPKILWWMKGTTFLLAGLALVLSLHAEPTQFVGYLRREVFPGATLQQIEQPGLAPAIVHLISKAEAPINIDNNFSQRISGYFVPPEDGYWDFYIASKDASKLYVSPDDNPARKILVAEQLSGSLPNAWKTVLTTNSTSSFEIKQKNSWTFTPDNGQSHPGRSIVFEKGKRYYIEAIMRNDQWDDNLSFTAMRHDFTLTNLTPTTLTGSNITVDVTLPTRLAIKSQPVSTNVNEFSSAMFRVEVDSDCDIISYQWRRNGNAINNATNRTFTEFATRDMDGSQYDVQVDALAGFPNGSSLLSRSARLSTTRTLLTLGLLRQEVFLGKTLNALRSAAVGLPDQVNLVTNVSVPREPGAYYAQRITGMFTPATNGNYHFIIASSDQADFYLATNASHLSKRLIAQQLTWGGPNEWQTTENRAKRGGDEVTQKKSATFKPAGQRGTPPYQNGIPLKAGTNYYFEIQHEVQRGNTPNLAITCYLANQTSKLLSKSGEPQNWDAPNLQKMTATSMALYFDNKKVARDYGEIVVLVRWPSEIGPVSWGGSWVSWVEDKVFVARHRPIEGIDVAWALSADSQYGSSRWNVMPAAKGYPTAPFTNTDKTQTDTRLTMPHRDSFFRLELSKPVETQVTAPTADLTSKSGRTVIVQSEEHLDSGKEVFLEWKPSLDADWVQQGPLTWDPESKQFRVNMPAEGSMGFFRIISW